MKLSLLLAATMTTLSATAVNPIPAGYTVDNLAREIISSSASTDLLFVEAEAAAAATASAGNLPDPELEGEYLFGPDSRSNRWNAGVSWSLDWPGAYKARARQGRAEGDMARNEAMAQAAGNLTEVKTLLVEVVAANRTLSLLREILADSDSIAAYSLKASRGGEISILDLQKIKVENARTRARILNTENARKATIDDINARYGTNLDAEQLSNLTYTVMPLLTREEYRDLTLTSPEAQLSEARTKVAEASINSARADRLPGIGIGYTHAYEEGTHFNGGAISLSLPIFSQRGKLKEAQLAAFAASSAARVTMETLTRETDQLYDRVKTLRSQLDELGPVFETTSHLPLMHKAYTAGQWTLVDYLTERSYFIEAHLEYLDLQRQYEATLARLNRYR